MNVKLISLLASGAVVTTGTSIVIWQLNKTITPVAEATVVPSGRTMKTKYPKLVVRSYRGSSNDVMYNNSFWRDKVKLLKGIYYKDPKIWTPLLASFKSSKEEAKYSLGDNYFDLDSSGSFLGGEIDISEIIAKYCTYNWDKENKDIENYVDVLKNLCT